MPPSADAEDFSGANGLPRLIRLHARHAAGLPPPPAVIRSSASIGGAVEYICRRSPRTQLRTPRRRSALILLSDDFEQFVKNLSSPCPIGPDDTPFFVVRFDEPVDFDSIIETAALTCHMLTTTNLRTGARCPVGADDEAGNPVTAAGVLVFESPQLVEFMLDTSGWHTAAAVRSMLMSIRDLFSAAGHAAGISSDPATDDQGIAPPGHRHVTPEIDPVLKRLGLDG